MKPVRGIGRGRQPFTMHTQMKLCAEASLIHKNWILTAARCFIGENTLSQNGTTVYLGLTHRLRDMHFRAQEFNVIEVITHPKYIKKLDGGEHNDIALLRLDREARLNPFVRTVCLPPSHQSRANWYVNPRRMAFVTGWGRTSFNGHNSFALMEIMIPPVLDSSCRRVMNKKGIAMKTTTEFCAGSENGMHDACQGDSGDPLVVQRLEKYRQIGIVSYGARCGETYGVYTRVSHYVDWIEGIINE
eukprot:XP_011666955.1 PREDICTED: vitamin K-dependent protein C-like [Strongylocentrotus purpuratus]